MFKLNILQLNIMRQWQKFEEKEFSLRFILIYFLKFILIHVEVFSCDEMEFWRFTLDD